MTVAELLDTLDARISDAEARRLRGRDVVLDLVGRSTVLGCRGTRLGRHADLEVDVWGFTLAQARAMRTALLLAAQEDAQHHAMP